MIVFGDLSLTMQSKVETFTATNAQNDYTLTNTPVGDVVFTRNGQTLPTTAYSLAGNVVSFVPAGTGSDLTAADPSDSTIKAGDLITIQYFREVQ